MGRGIIALTALAVALFVAPQAMGATTRVVDDDGKATAANCNSATLTFWNIQDAVNAAASGDTIQICPGLYSGGPANPLCQTIVPPCAEGQNAVVDKKLNIFGARSGQTTYEKQCGTYSPNPTVDTIIEPLDPSLPILDLQWDRIVVRGIVFQQGTLAPAVFASDSFSGHVVERNLFRDNDSGVELESSGTFLSKVNGNCFRDNSYGAFSTTSLSNAQIHMNTFRDQTSYGVFLTGTPTNVTVSGNKSYTDDTFAYVDAADSVTISGNIVKTPVTTGILVGGHTGVQVSGNILEKGDGTGILISSIGLPGTGLKVSGNIVKNFAGTGIWVDDDSTNDGFFTGNIVSNNGDDGLRINDLNTGNTIGGNILKGNAVHDCHDDTAGPDNDWQITNTGAKKQNRPDLCRKAAVTAPVYPATH